MRRSNAALQFGSIQDDMRRFIDPHVWLGSRGLRMIHELRVGGETYRGIGTILARKGYLARNGKPVSATVIMRALRQPPPA